VVVVFLFVYPFTALLLLPVSRYVVEVSLRAPTSFAHPRRAGVRHVGRPF